MSCIASLQYGKQRHFQTTVLFYYTEGLRSVGGDLSRPVGQLAQSNWMWLIDFNYQPLAYWGLDQLGLFSCVTK